MLDFLGADRQLLGAGRDRGGARRAGRTCARSDLSIRRPGADVRQRRKRRPIPAFRRRAGRQDRGRAHRAPRRGALTTDSSVLTAIANDYGFERVFSRQIEALGPRRRRRRSRSAPVARRRTCWPGSRPARRAGMTTIGLCGGARLPPIPIPSMSRFRCRRMTHGQRATGAPGDRTCVVPGRSTGCCSIRTATLVTAAAGSVLTLPELLELRGRRGRRPGGSSSGRTDASTLFHSGHLGEPEGPARRLGDVLLVGVNSDWRRRTRLKGDGRPLMPEACERAADHRRAEIGRSRHDLRRRTPLRRSSGSCGPMFIARAPTIAPPAGKPVPERATVEAYGGRVEFLPLLDGSLDDADP